MRAAFAKAVTPSEVLLRSTERELDAYAAAWTAMRHEACEATRARGAARERPRSPHDLPRFQAEELRALTGQLVSADRAMALKGPQAAADLTSLAPCADIAALTAVTAPPKDPKAIAEVEKAREVLSEARVFIHLGRDPRATELATGSAGPRASRALRARGSRRPLHPRITLGHSGDNLVAEAELLTSFSRALASRSDEIAVDAATNLAQIENYSFARPAGRSQVGGALRATACSIGRGTGDEQRARLLQVEAWVHYEEGDGKGAIPLAREEAEHIAGMRVFGAGDLVQLATFLNALGAAYDKGGQATKTQSGRKSVRLRITGTQFGEDHPNYAASLANVAEVETELGDYASALPLLQKAVELYTRLLREKNGLQAGDSGW